MICESATLDTISIRSKKREHFSLATRGTLIRALSDIDAGRAWTDFYEIYAPVIIGYAMKRGCSKELAEDVLQETVMALNIYLKKNTYDREKGKFRSLLFRFTDFKIVDAFRRHGRISKLRRSEMFKIEAEEKETEQDERVHMWDEEWSRHILDNSMDEARRRVSPMTFRCFEEIFLQKRPVKEVSKRVNLSPNLVSQHKFKVLQIIIQTAKALIANHAYC